MRPHLLPRTTIDVQVDERCCVCHWIWIPCLCRLQLEPSVTFVASCLNASRTRYLGPQAMGQANNNRPLRRRSSHRSLWQRMHFPKVNAPNCRASSMRHRPLKAWGSKGLIRAVNEDHRRSMDHELDPRSMRLEVVEEVRRPITVTIPIMEMNTRSAGRIVQQWQEKIVRTKIKIKIKHRNKMAPLTRRTVLVLELPRPLTINISIITSVVIESVRLPPQRQMRRVPRVAVVAAP